MQTRLLVGTQRALKRLAQDRPAQVHRDGEALPAFRRATARRYSLAPADGSRICRAIGANAGAGQQTHGLAEGQAFIGGAALDRLELFQRAGEAFAIDLDPLATDESEPFRLGKQPLQLGLRKCVTIERHLHLEVEQRVQPDLRRRLAADRHFHLRMRGAVLAPACRHAHDHAGAFQSRDILEECQGLRRAPAQRMIDLARIDHGLQPRALLSRALNRQQQR